MIGPIAIGVTVCLSLVYSGFALLWSSVGLLESVASYGYVLVILGVGHLGTVLVGMAVRSVWSILGAFRSVVIWFA